MVKLIALLKRKSNLSPEQFASYYETWHVPLIRTLQPEICLYRRNYLTSAPARIGPAAQPPDFDVITELGFPDQEAYTRAMATFSDPAVRLRISQDEEHFLDRASTRLLVVDPVTCDLEPVRVPSPTRT